MLPQFDAFAKAFCGHVPEHHSQLAPTKEYESGYGTAPNTARLKKLVDLPPEKNLFTLNS